MTIRASALAALLAVSLLTSPSFAQTPPLEQALAEMRNDIQARADNKGYPIAGIDPQDAREVLASIHSLDRDEWAAAWSARADVYMARAKAAKDKPAQRDAYLAAWRLYMFAAWPARTSPGKEAAYHKAADAYRAYGALLDPAVEVVRIPYEGKEIVGYLRLPKGVRPAPVVIAMGGLDEFKEYEALGFDKGALAHGLGVFAMDMPGVGESAVPMAVGSERVFSRVIDYLAGRKEVDAGKLGIYGVSAGGYWSALMAYVEPKRLRAAAAFGAPTDGYFTEAWQRKSWGTKEYLFGLKEARMFVYGTNDEAVFLERMSHFSLKTRGLLDKPSAPLLLGNGANDTQVPIADLYLPLTAGSPKFSWVNPTGGHTGRGPGWSEERVNSEVVAAWFAGQMK